MAKKILFIEDESALQKAVTQVLSEEGYQVLSALDGEIGLKLAQKELPNLVLLDLILPKKDGFEVLTELKQGQETKQIPIIIINGAIIMSHNKIFSESSLKINLFVNPTRLLAPIFFFRANATIA